jgi:endonuclease/exonuclease/phosphatase family metal-dependent hydrolase
MIEPEHVIDHIFVHGGLDVLAAEVLDPKTEAGRFASDHLPVRAKIAVRPAAAPN